MARIKVKLFGVFRIDTRTAELELEAERLKDVFPALKEKLGAAPTESGLKFEDAVVYLNGEVARKKSAKLADGDELWLLSPASGG